MITKNRLEELVQQGKISSEMADKLRTTPPPPTEVTITHPTSQAIETHVRTRPSKPALLGKYLFDHNLEQTHFGHRLDAKEGVSQPIGLMAYGVIGAIDAVVDSTFYLIGELTEDVTFGVSRIVYRAESGWNRGKTGTDHE